MSTTEDPMSPDDRNLLVRLNTLVELLLRKVDDFGESLTDLRSTQTRHGERLATLEAQGAESRRLPNWVPVAAMAIAAVSVGATVVIALVQK